MRARGKIGSIGVVVDIEMVDIDVADDEEPESESEVEIEVGSWVEGAADWTELEISPRLYWIWKKRRSIEVELIRSEEVRPIRST